MAMPSLCAVPSFFKDDCVRTIREDGYERTFDLNPFGDGSKFLVIVIVWPHLHKVMLKAKGADNSDIAIPLAYEEEDFNLVYNQLHVNWYALKAMIESGIIKSLV